MNPGDFVLYRLRPTLNFVLREIKGNVAVIATVVSEKRYLKGVGGVYKPSKKEWLLGHKEVHVGDLSPLGMVWGGDGV